MEGTMKNIRKFIVQSVFAFGVSCAVWAADQGSAAVRGALGPYIDRGEIAGVISVLSDADYRETWDFFGYADAENKVPMKADTVFAIFSMSKTFLGAAMMCGIDDGVISLDDKVSKFLPEYKDVKFADGHRPKRELTIRDVTSHQDGMAKEISFINNSIPLRDAAKWYAAQPMSREPGTSFSYGTMRFSVAAAALEVATGKKFEVYLKERILDPLGMKDTTFTPNADQVRRLVKAYTTRGGKYRPGNDHCCRQLKFPKAKKIEPAPGAGLFSTAADMIRFSQMLAHHGTWKGKTVISRKTFDTVFAVPQTGKLSGNPYTCGCWLYGDWFGHEGAMRTDQRANLKTGHSRVFFIQTENAAGAAFFKAKADWMKACDGVQKPGSASSERLLRSHENDVDRSKDYQKK